MRSRRLNTTRDLYSVVHNGDFDVDDEICHITRLRSEPCSKTSRVFGNAQKIPIPAIKMLSAREANYSGRGKFSLADRAHVLGQYLPVHGPAPVDEAESRVYTSQFSADGSLFIAGLQGRRIKVYDVDNKWALQKNISTRRLHWTITDIALSPSKKFLVYSSLSPILHIANVGTGVTESEANITEIHEGLDLSLHADEEFSFNIFSVRFSADARELVVGSGDCSIYVYDLEAKKLVSRCEAHTDDVNSVTFADETGHLIFSGSDDHLCKVWDRRCSIESGRAVGVLPGHLEGITFIDSRGDGRYFISNGKDQAIKLWDTRKMLSNSNFSRPRICTWDYRWGDYPDEARNFRHPNDQSVATYRGHSVLYTLIRCYFSPEFSTGQKYIYAGSSDMSVYIYDVVTGTLVSKLTWHDGIIRDCSWHPYEPVLVSSSWDCRIAKWEYPGPEVGPREVKRRRRRRYNYY